MSDPYRSRATLLCTEEGCTVSYTYLGGTPRVQHSVADIERDLVLARQAAHEWGWDHDGTVRDRTDRCPRHVLELPASAADEGD